MNFNSIKVRLEPYAGKGLGFNKRFQFHKGTIRTVKLVMVHTRFRNFNSIKVRLERTGQTSC